ncbi:MAG: tetratricopeptide repeat protein [Burkholderiaceae bacterium]|jgi:predicted negative regulator of RcsB-dependent stress response|nr:tetratricopeptide repeat protein [Burkholderiaceae bacterium]
MAYDLEEQEQLASIKAWWERWGNLVLTTVTVVLLAIAAFNGWRWYERHEAGNAGVLYDQFVAALDGGDLARKKELAGTLIERYGRTVYAPMAALQIAKANVDAGDRAAARAQLRWVIDKSGHAELVQIARLRLAGVLLDEKAYEEALKALAGDVPEALAAAFADRRGDVLMAAGKADDARSAYREALDRAGPQHPLRPVIQLKLDALPSAAS